MLEQITEAAERGEVIFVASTYLIAELVKDPESAESAENNKLTPKQERIIEDFLENDFFVIRTLTTPIAHLSRQIARDFGIKPKDAVHIATAVFWKVPIFHTYERKLLNKTGLIGDPPLIIEEPTWVGQNRFLFEAAANAEITNEDATNSIAKETGHSPIAGVPELPESSAQVSVNPQAESGTGKGEAGQG